MKIPAGFALALLLSGCGATHQVIFDPWRGLEAGLAKGLKQGEMGFSKDAVFKAATDVLEHEPFLKWEFMQMDPKAGLIEASADDGRLVKLSIADAAGASLNASARVSVALPQRKLDGEKKVWMSRNDSLIVTPYDIEFSKREPWEDLSATFELDQDYLISAIHRQLTDKSAVPFTLEVLNP